MSGKKTFTPSPGLFKRKPGWVVPSKNALDEDDLDVLSDKLDRCGKKTKKDDCVTKDKNECAWDKTYEKCTAAELRYMGHPKYEKFKDLLSVDEINKIIKTGKFDEVELAKNIANMHKVLEETQALVNLGNLGYKKGQNVVTAGDVDLQYRNQIASAQKKRMSHKQRKLLNSYNVLNAQLRDQINARLDHEQYILNNIHTLLHRHNDLSTNHLVPRQLENLAYAQNALNPLLRLAMSQSLLKGGRRSRKSKRTNKKSRKRSRRSRKSRGGNTNGARVSLSASPFI